MSLCSSNIPIFENDPLKGCNGEPHSDVFLLEAFERSTLEEDYRLCRIYSKELIKRGYRFQSTGVFVKAEDY